MISLFSRDFVRPERCQLQPFSMTCVCHVPKFTQRRHWHKRQVMTFQASTGRMCRFRAFEAHMTHPICSMALEYLPTFGLNVNW